MFHFLIRRLLRTGLPVALASLRSPAAICGIWSIPTSRRQRSRRRTRTSSFSPDSAQSVSVEVSAPLGNADSNNRGVFWSAGQTPSRDGETCARAGKPRIMAHASPPTSKRERRCAVRKNADGSLDAITVTRNVWLDGSWIFNVNLWHVTDTYKPGLTTMLGANLHATLGDVPSLPWDMCAKVVGSKLSFIIWLSQRQAKPAYGDVDYGGTVTLPPNEIFVGQFGIYVGHLAPGQSVDYDQMRVTRR